MAFLTFRMHVLILAAYVFAAIIPYWLSANGSKLRLTMHR